MPYKEPIVDPTDSTIKTFLSSAYKSGWPLPSELSVSTGIRLPAGTDGDFITLDEDWADREETVKIFRTIYEDNMIKMVTWALSVGLIDHLLALGPLAKKDFNRAMYLIGYLDEL